MRKIKSLVLLIIIFTIVACPTFNVFAYSESIDFQSHTIENGETIIWDGSNDMGYQLPAGCRMVFQVFTDKDAYIELYIFKRTPDGGFVAINSVPAIANADSYALIDGYVPESGRYAFGLYNYALTTRTFSGRLTISDQ